MANQIQLKRGVKANLPTLASGEPGWCTDTYELFIGDGTTNHQAVIYDLFNAGTFLYAASDNTPEAKTSAEVMALLSGQSGADFSMNNHKITALSDPTAAQDAATKTYVDDLVAHGLTFHERVLDKDTLTPPGTPATGDRYWIGGTGTGAWAGHDYDIAEYDGASWVFDGVTEGDTAFVDDEGVYYFYDGTVLKQLNTAIGNHASSHISGATDEIDGDKIDIDWNPTNYTPTTSPAEVDSVDQLTAHLAGIDAAVGASAGTSFTGLTDTPADYTGAALKVVRVNSTPDALEFVDFSSTYLEASPTNGETSKAPDSNWAYDHNAAVTGVHGAGANSLLNSGSTIDGGAFV